MLPDVSGEQSKAARQFFIFLSKIPSANRARYLKEAASKYGITPVSPWDPPAPKPAPEPYPFASPTIPTIKD